MEFIRSQRASEGYNMHGRHLLYGLDADLIMLGLATHEAHISVLREVVFGSCEQCGHYGHILRDCPLWYSSEPHVAARLAEVKVPLEVVELFTLRDYIEFEFLGNNSELRAYATLDRLIDDFVFLTFFVGGTPTEA